MIITTTPGIEGKTILEYKRIVFGEYVDLRYFAGWTPTDAIKSSEPRLAQAKCEALNRMIHQASQIGANAVVGVTIHIEMPAVQYMFVSATGTAVVVE